MGDVHYRHEMPGAEYRIEGDPETGVAVVTERLFARIGDYTRSSPTGPSPGRVYRKNLGWGADTPDSWWLFLCEAAPADDPRGGVLHYPYRVVLVDNAAAVAAWTPDPPPAPPAVEWDLPPLRPTSFFERHFAAQPPHGTPR